MELFIRLSPTLISKMGFNISRKPFPILWLRNTAVIPGIVSSFVALFKKSNYKEIKRYILRHLLGITKLDKENYQRIRESTEAENIKGNKTVPGKVATTHTKDGHKKDT